MNDIWIRIYFAVIAWVGIGYFVHSINLKKKWQQFLFIVFLAFVANIPFIILLEKTVGK